MYTTALLLPCPCSQPSPGLGKLHVSLLHCRDETGTGLYTKRVQGNASLLPTWCIGSRALLPAGPSVGKNNPWCPGHIGQVGGRVEFGFSAEIPAEISSVPRFPHLCVGTVSFPGGQVELGMLRTLLRGGQAVSTWSCVSNCRLRKNPTQHIKFLSGDLFFALLLKLVPKFSVLCPFPSSYTCSEGNMLSNSA